MRRGHWVALDCVVGALAALAIVVSALNSGTGAFPGRLLAALIIAAAVFVPVGFRRLRPVPAYGALIVLALLLAQHGKSAALLALLAAAYVLYVVTAEGSRRTGVVALAIGLALAVALFAGVADFTHPAVVALGLRIFSPGAVPVSFVLLVCWMAGQAVRQRRAYASVVQHQAASKAVTEERLRIARELHDVVAHSMSVIAVQAGFGQYVIDSSPADAREALGAIQATSRDALEEMRRMLGVLRRQDAVAEPSVSEPSVSEPSVAGPAVAGPAVAPLAPAPGLSVLDRLIERTSGTGVRVTMERSGAVRDVPAGVDLSAYRIVQEALTNSVKHAGPDASCVVSVQYTEESLFVEVTDDGGRRAAAGEAPGTAPAAGGHGIIGMRERAALCGGTLETGPTASGGFRVAATLPLHPASALAGGTA
jgi:signal transduction histidine kinase